MDYVTANQEPTKGAAPVSAGLGSIVRIPVPGTDGLAIEFRPRGWTPKTGSTSSLFIQDLSGKRHLRLDLGFNKVSQVHEWHWNQKGTAANFGIANHTSVGVGEQILGRAAKMYKFSGRTLVVVGVAVDAYSIVTSTQPLRRSIQVVSGWAGAAAGCKVLGAGGAAAGTVAAPGVGTAAGGFLGCAIGGFIGYIAAERAVGHLYDWGQGALFTKVAPEPSAPFQGGGGHSRGYGASGSW